MNQKNDIQKLLDKASKDATVIISSPNTIKKLQAQGIPIEEKFTSYDDYFEKLIAEKRRTAIILLQQLPLLDKTIANSVIEAIYEEIRASFGLCIFTSTIFNSIILLEYAMRVRVFEERLKGDKNTKWEHVEKLKMRNLIQKLKEKEIIDKKGKAALENFNDKFRNPYLHINIHQMIQGIYANNVKVVNTKTNTLSIKNKMDISKYRHLWFIAKKFYDKTYVLGVLNFCVGWTNKLLSRSEPQTKT